MKKRITIEQVLMLNSQEANELRSWWKPEKFELAYQLFNKKETIIGDEVEGKVYSYEQDWMVDKKELLPLLTIGDMFELIHKKTGIWPEPFRAGIEGPEEQWNIDNEFVQSYEVELCDLLWNIVTLVLSPSNN